jgi:precorrin-6A/cobalt-precorrin-6A reductase
VRILILGGTGEARELAAELVAAGTDVLSSLAGRVSRPRLPDGAVRIGGFGGADGLAACLRDEGITHLVDATHPFAVGISANAALAAESAGVPRLVLRRPEWGRPERGRPERGRPERGRPERGRPEWGRPEWEGDPSWETTPDIAGAAAAVLAWEGDGVFLTTGRRDLAAFAADDRHRFLIRTVDPPQRPLPPRMTLILDRGPYTVEGEAALLREHEIGLLVTKNSGGPMTAAKLTAARDLGVQVLMVDRPPLPHGSTVVATVAQALGWLGVGGGGQPGEPGQPG